MRAMHARCAWPLRLACTACSPSAFAAAASRHAGRAAAQPRQLLLLAACCCCWRRRCWRCSGGGRAGRALAANAALLRLATGCIGAACIVRAGMVSKGGGSGRSGEGVQRGGHARWLVHAHWSLLEMQWRVSGSAGPMGHALRWAVGEGHAAQQVVPQPRQFLAAATRVGHIQRSVPTAAPTRHPAFRACQQRWPRPAGARSRTTTALPAPPHPICDRGGQPWACRWRACSSSGRPGPPGPPQRPR